jgi:CheY-like chemotaxis protein
LARRILLADDSVTAQNMGRRILHDAGYEVVTVNNGSAALKKIAEQKPDLIILDVYMPGYGGLEVCSRLKETRETARIPVLLTVGKLEPFKPEEARRVRADAYIVKPFEASELLTALTKLEDKIVPGPEPYKQGRFAKAMAAVEHSGAEQDFGDQETGWKDRLIIPGGKKAKTAEPEAEPEPMPAKGVRGAARGEDFRPAEPRKDFERPIPAGIPQDISAGEIAAIAAAAAKISGRVVEDVPAPVVEAKAEPVVEARAEPAVEAPAVPEAEATQKDAATFASAPVEEAAATPAAAPAAEVAPEVETEKVAEVVPEPAPEGVVAPAAPAEATPAADTVPQEDKRSVNDAEVLAALASLMPAGGDFSISAPAQEVAATMSEPAAVGASFTGPRWIAEAVAVGEEESTFLLEREMEKTYAAFAAADAGRAVQVAAVEAVAPSNGNGHGGSAASETAVAEAAPVVETVVKSEETVPAPEPVQEPVAAVASETVAPAVEESAYAAAASAGTAEAAVSETLPVASVESSDSSTGVEEGSKMREAELAAAWANWRQIRESIIGTQPGETGEAASDVAAAQDVPVQEARVEEPAVPPPAEMPTELPAEDMKAQAPEEPAAAATEAPAQGDPSEISNIVDNMLAELKPKLMEELKKKLGK